MKILQAFLFLFPMLAYFTLLIPFLMGDVPSRILFLLIIPYLLIAIVDSFRQWRIEHKPFVLLLTAVHSVCFALTMYLILNRSTAKVYDLPLYNCAYMMFLISACCEQIWFLLTKEMGKKEKIFQICALVGWLLCILLRLSILFS